jgi:hypothetical protein
MQTRTIQYVKPTRQIHSEPGWRRCDWLNQRKIEKTVEQHDQFLRNKYAQTKSGIGQNAKPKKQRVRKNASGGVQKESTDTGRNKNNKPATSDGGKAQIKLP